MKLVVAWGAVACWAAFIFFMSAHTGSDFDGEGLVAQAKRWLTALVAPVFGPETDVVSVAAHFCEYLAFGALLFVALRVTCPDVRSAMLVLGAVVLASAYGVTDELHQLFVPGRLCDPADWLTDTLGAALGAGVAVLVVRSASTHARLRVKSATLSSETDPGFPESPPCLPQCCESRSTPR